jgi:hypothetical protein
MGLTIVAAVGLFIVLIRSLHGTNDATGSSPTDSVPQTPPPTVIQQTVIETVPASPPDAVTPNNLPTRCPGNFVPAVINGQPKCLGALQQCQEALANDYLEYGFKCTQIGNRHQLTARDSSNG